MSFIQYLDKLLNEDNEKEVEKKPKLITTTFAIVTPESAEHGDNEETGFIDEEGEDMTPDEYDIDEGITAVDKAVDFMKKKNGAFEPSSSRYDSRVWYSNPEYNQDYSTGAQEERSYHLGDGWTEEEKKEIFNRMTKRG